MKSYSKDLSTSGGRLAYLFSEMKYNIDNCALRTAIRTMFDKGVLEYSPIKIDKGDSKKVIDEKTKDRQKKDIDNAYTQIIRHLNNKPIDVVWLKRYHDFFNCTSDFLLGLSDKAFNDTGLNDIAIKNLRIYSQEDKEILNNLLIIKRGMIFRFMLRAIKIYLNGNYRIPIYHKIICKEDGVTIRKGIVPDDAYDYEEDQDGNKTYILHLQDDNLSEHDTLQIPIDDDFVEGIALKMIDKHLIKFKEQYKKNKK